MGLSTSSLEQTDLHKLQSVCAVYSKPNADIIVNNFVKYCSRTFFKDTILCYLKMSLGFGPICYDGAYQYNNHVSTPRHYNYVSTYIEDLKKELLPEITNIIIKRLGITEGIDVVIDDFIEISVTIPRNRSYEKCRTDF
jgi:hypothetical protein